MKKILSVLCIIAILGAFSVDNKAFASKDKVPELLRVSSVSIEKLSY